MSRVLIRADFHTAFGEMCCGTPYFLMTPGIVGMDAPAAARAFVEGYAPDLRGPVDRAPAACYEMRWIGIGEGPDGLGRLCAFAQPWQTVEELIAAADRPGRGLHVLLPIDGVWVQHSTDLTAEHEPDARWEAQ